MQQNNKYLSLNALWKRWLVLVQQHHLRLTSTFSSEHPQTVRFEGWHGTDSCLMEHDGPKISPLSLPWEIFFMRYRCIETYTVFKCFTRLHPPAKKTRWRGHKLIFMIAAVGHQLNSDKRSFPDCMHFFG